MSENRHNDDPLEEAIRAFQGMTAPERPADAEVLARLAVCQGELSPPSPPSLPIPSNRSYLMVGIVLSTAAAVLLFGGAALYLRNGSPPELAQVAAPDPSGKGQGAAGAEAMPVDSFEQRLKESPVIVVATAVDSVPAPPDELGDSEEFSIRFQVKRVLKGQLDKHEIRVRTSFGPALFVGKDWIVWLSPDYLSGKHPGAPLSSSDLEPKLKKLLAKEKE